MRAMTSAVVPHRNNIDQDGDCLRSDGHGNSYRIVQEQAEEAAVIFQS